MSFQKSVVIIATVILLITLYLIYRGMKKRHTSESWPPVVSECPDYWLDVKGSGEACINTHRLGTCNIPDGTDKNAKNFNVAPYNSADTGACSKYKWATACGVSWDGITYGVNNPCDEIED